MCVARTCRRKRRKIRLDKRYRPRALPTDKLPGRPKIRKA